jgi:hypothetical protein
VSFPGHDAFAGKALEPYTVNGVEKGTFKTQDNFSFLRVFEAGHMVMYYRKLIAKFGWTVELTSSRTGSVAAGVSADDGEGSDYGDVMRMQFGNCG